MSRALRLSCGKTVVTLVTTLLLLGGLTPPTVAAERPPDQSKRGTTHELPSQAGSDGEFVDGRSSTIARPQGARAAYATTLGREATTDPAWELIEEQSLFQRLGVGERFAIRFDQSAESLTALEPSDPLTVQARQAVDKAPDWLAKQLEDQFAGMSSSQQDTWAGMILDANDPNVDEVAFLVAHISKDDLASSRFNSQLITDAATYAYEVDGYLDYVEVADHGSAADGGDYYTTLVYDVELDGTVSSVEYPRELYYWGIIHPRGSDEDPAYINPTPCKSNGDAAAPPTGKFWQRWLFYNTENSDGGNCDTDWDGTRDDPCLLLKDTLAGIPVLWKHVKNGTGAENNGAVGAVNEWVRKSIGPFGDHDGCRPVQPVQVYYWGDGNCGEFADLTMAAGRAALIPTEVTGARGNDHVWNEFYDQQWSRWVQWEPINNMIDSNYSGWWGGGLYVTNTYRGDTYCHTELTTMHSETGTLTVTTYDLNHYPLEGAEVTLEYDAFGGILFFALNVGHTNKDGEATFVIGDTKDYYVSVHTDWGDAPRTLVVSNSQPDTDYTWSPADFPGEVPRLDASDASSPGTLDDYMLEAEVTVVEGYVHGTEGMIGGRSYTKEWPGDLDTFVVDQTNWDLFTSDSAFEAFALTLNDPGHDLDFVPPEAGDWFLAWSNKAAVNMSHVIRGTVRLYRNTGGVPPVQALSVDKNGDGHSLLDWEDVTGQNVAGYIVYRSTEAADIGRGRTELELEPFLLASPSASEYEDEDPVLAGTCFFYSIRTRSSRGGISE